MLRSSAFQKGKRFELFIAKEIEMAGLGSAHREIGSGLGKRKGDIACNLPFLLEVKNQRSLQWWQAIDQAKEQAIKGNYAKEKWALVVKDIRFPDNSEIYAMIDFWQFLGLLKKNSEPLIKEPDRELKYLLERARQVLGEIIKKIE